MSHIGECCTAVERQRVAGGLRAAVEDHRLAKVPRGQVDCQRIVSNQRVHQNIAGDRSERHCDRMKVHTYHGSCDYPCDTQDAIRIADFKFAGRRVGLDRERVVLSAASDVGYDKIATAIELQFRRKILNGHHDVVAIRAARISDHETVAASDERATLGNRDTADLERSGHGDRVARIVVDDHERVAVGRAITERHVQVTMVDDDRAGNIQLVILRADAGAVDLDLEI